MNLTAIDFFGKVVWTGGSDQERAERLRAYEATGMEPEGLAEMKNAGHEAGRRLKMAEYIELSAAICIANYAADEHPYEKDREKPETFSDYNQGWNDACDYIQGKLEAAETVDAAPVVRCECCVYGEQYKRMDGENGYYCKHPENAFEYWQNQKKFTPTKGKNDFCSFGKERKDAE